MKEDCLIPHNRSWHLFLFPPYRLFLLTRNHILTVQRPLASKRGSFHLSWPHEVRVIRHIVGGGREIESSEGVSWSLTEHLKLDRGHILFPSRGQWPPVFFIGPEAGFRPPRVEVGFWSLVGLFIKYILVRVWILILGHIQI